MNLDGPTAPHPLDGAFTAQWLTGETFPALQYVVPGLIPEGLTMLSAAPKIGKSWMVLGIGVAAATGGRALGRIPVTRRPVLYLALEDGQLRLQDRLKALDAYPGPAGLAFMTDTPAGAVATIDAFFDLHSDAKPLIILDTLGKVRSVYSGNDAYQKDYGQMSALKDLVDARPGSSLVIVHHTRKSEGGDFLDSVSGTQGLAGAADSVLVLRRGRGEGAATLNVTSRDAVEGEYALTLTDGAWMLNGSTLAEAATAVEQHRATHGVGDAMVELVTKVGQYPEGTRAVELATMLGWERSKVDVYLGRAYDAGRIEKLSRGLYGPVRSVGSVRPPNNALPLSDTYNPSNAHF